MWRQICLDILTRILALALCPLFLGVSRVSRVNPPIPYHCILFCFFLLLLLLLWLLLLLFLAVTTITASATNPHKLSLFVVCLSYLLRTYIAEYLLHTSKSLVGAEVSKFVLWALIKIPPDSLILLAG